MDVTTDEQHITKTIITAIPLAISFANHLKQELTTFMCLST